jgi:hypothetical protein
MHLIMRANLLPLSFLQLKALALGFLVGLLSLAQPASAQFQLVRVGQVYPGGGGMARGVTVAGDYAFLANNEDGLRVYNVADPAQPREVYHFQNPPDAVSAYSRAVCVSGRYAYLANGFDGLRIFDMADPTNAVNVGHVSTGGFAVNVAVSGNYAYLADGGLSIFDVSNPASAVLLAQTNNGGNASSIALAGPYAYLANDSDGLRVYDMSNPSQPINVGHTNISKDVSTENGAVAIALAGHYAYVAHESWGLQLYDLSEPATPAWVNGLSFGSTADGVAVSEQGRYAFVACYPDGLHMCDVSAPDNIQSVCTTYDPEFPYGVAVQGNYVYVADGLRGLRVYLAVPQLQIAPTGTNTVLLSWPQPVAEGFTLQQTAELNPATWVAVTDAPTVVGNQCQLVVAPQRTRGFYRLSFGK